MPRSIGPVEHHLTPDMVVPPVFRHFVDLERDSKYYMMLLRVRETEIERCTKAYEDLQITLKYCLNTNSKLKDRIEFLERMVSDGSQTSRSGIESYKIEVAGLTRKLAEAKRNDDVRIHEMQNEFKRKILETDSAYTDKLNRQEREFGKKVDELNVKLQRETILNSKLKSDLESMMNMNVSLKNKITLLKSKNSSDKASLEVEVSELKNINENISGEVMRLRRELDRSTDLNGKFKQIIHEYQSEVQQGSSRYEEVSRLNKTCKHINMKLNGELWGCKQKNKELKTRLEKLITEEGRLKEEIQRLRILDNVVPGHVQCNISKHGNYEHVTRQNAVLQEIVKTMRKERTSKEREDLRHAEERIDKLEDTIESFKMNGVFNDVTVHRGGNDGDN